MEILRPYYHRVRRAGRSSEGGHRKKGGDKDNHPATSGGGFTTEESKLKWLEPAAWWKKSKTDGSWMKLSERGNCTRSIGPGFRLREAQIIGTRGIPSFHQHPHNSTL
ncbi:hypothetical protein VTN49DRAFT_5504 [Thermomyces lanuginosus]|uniref:uncharacterized protein n=1 Tax=Thermomyces lanuginosus TaxID=5541 RepID=UPI0037437CA9